MLIVSPACNYGFSVSLQRRERNNWETNKKQKQNLNLKYFCVSLWTRTWPIIDQCGWKKIRRGDVISWSSRWKNMFVSLKLPQSMHPTMHRCCWILYEHTSFAKWRQKKFPMKVLLELESSIFSRGKKHVFHVCDLWLDV